MRWPLRYAGKLQGVPVYVVRAAWFRKRFMKDVLAFTWGRRIVFRSTKVLHRRDVQKHELEHIRQRDRVGSSVIYALRYAWYRRVYNRWDHPYELAARRAENQ